LPALTDIGTLGGTYSVARAVNNNMQVVGDAARGTGRAHAFVWQSGTMYDLNDLIASSDWELGMASGINDHGQIVGTGLFQGTTTPFLMSPINTLTGTNEIVSLASGVTVSFATVTSPGNTVVSAGTAGPTPPAGFSLGNPPTYFDINTTAAFTGPVVVCLSYNQIQFSSPAGLRLFHFENDQWVDVTTSSDTTKQSICGSVTSLSPFVIAQPTDTSPPTTTSNSFGVLGANDWFRGPVTTTLAATDPDGATDVASTYYTIDNGAAISAAGQFVVSNEAKHILLFWSVDKAGIRSSRRNSTSILT